MSASQLGVLLEQDGLVTRAQLEEAMEEQTGTGKTLGRILVDRGVLREEDLVRVLAQQIGMEFVDLAEEVVDPSVVSMIPEAMARRYQAIPISWRDGKILVAMADPSNVIAVDDIRSVTGAVVQTVVATRAQILDVIDRVDRQAGEAESMAQLVADEFDVPDDLSKIGEIVEDAPIVKFVNLLITRAVAERASDIHLEPTERDLVVRYRVDGVLHEVMRSPKATQAGVTSRLKIMADIDISERRIPQDGRISVTVGGKAIDLRVATLPTVYGEKVVMRILDKSQALLNLKDLGFLPESLARYESCYRKPYGAILVTGPTGSGKSTTLYATLNVLNSPDRNIITVEDPVEYRLSGINQVQINAKAGLTFAAALRSILRSDPDIVLVGEIRDRETAVIAAEAALTGHLVLSTLHTNDAASTPLRLVEMGIEPFLVSSALDCILAQRLARRLCERCKQAYQPSEAELREVGWPMHELEGGEWPTFFKNVGCAVCGRTGYKGRLAIHEVMIVSEEIERLIVERASSEDMLKTAVMQGMLTLRHEGLRKAAQGQTTIQEVFRVVA